MAIAAVAECLSSTSMAIKLWQRKQGFVRPPDPIHASPGSSRFPESFRTRVQSWSIEALQRCEWGTSMGEVQNPIDESLRSFCADLAEAYGRSILVPLSLTEGLVASSEARQPRRQLSAHLARCSDFEVLDLVDATVQKVTELLTAGLVMGDITSDIHAISSRFNEICEEEGVGYRWSEGELVRFDSSATHELAVEPAMALLSDPKYANADAEFRRALECYRASAWRDAITNANAALESVLKLATGQSRGTAGSLFAEARQRGLIPSYAEGAAESLVRLMNLVPAVRGQQGSSHGLGDREVQADEHLAQLVVSTAAAFIVFIARPHST